MKRVWLASTRRHIVSKIQTKLQFSAGGVAFRERDGRIEIVLISVGDDGRWQLPKGLIDKGETTEAAAVREVREEAGVECEPVERIDKVDYWYNWTENGERFRYHKFVYFYLLGYKSGDVADHDQEVNEARWVEVNDAIDMLAFDSERKIVEQAKKILLTA